MLVVYYGKNIWCFFLVKIVWSIRRALSRIYCKTFLISVTFLKKYTELCHCSSESLFNHDWMHSPNRFYSYLFSPVVFSFFFLKKRYMLTGDLRDASNISHMFDFLFSNSERKKGFGHRVALFNCSTIITSVAFVPITGSSISYLFFAVET